MVSKRECAKALNKLTLNCKYEEVEKDLSPILKIIEEYYGLIELFGLNKEYEKAEFNLENFQKSFEKVRAEQKKEFKEFNKERLESLRKKVQELESEIPELTNLAPILRPYKIQQGECEMEE